MKALATSPSGPRVQERDRPSCPPGWTRIRVAMAGVCRTDIAAARGELSVETGRILGHELAGWTPSGALVSVRPRLPDGRFIGLELDGAFAEELVVPTESLVPLPRGMSLQRAAFVEPVAAAMSVMRAPLSGRVALRGRGRIAELCRRVLTMSGVVLVPEAEGALDMLVITGIDGAVDLSSVRRGGRILLKGRPAGPVFIDQRAVVERELILQGVDYGDFAESGRVLASGALPVDDLFAEPLPLARFAEAFEGGEERKKFLHPGS